MQASVSGDWNIGRARSSGFGRAACSANIIGLLLTAVAALVACADIDAWVCPSDCPGDSDTEKAQYALDNHSRIYLDRDYDVTSVRIHRVGQRFDFRGYCLNGIDGDPQAEAVLHICGRAMVLRDVRVNANYGYKCAIRWHSLTHAKPAQYNKIFGMHIAKAPIGILYGAFSSPVDAPQSENAIFGLTFRCVHVCLHINQPNGFLYISNSVIDCNPFEWNYDRPGEFDDAAARTLHVRRGHIEIANSEILKTSTQKGYMMEIDPAGTVKLCNCHFESGAAAFLLRGSLWACNLSGLINNDSAPYFELSADADAGFSALTNCSFRRMMAVSRYSGMHAIRSQPDSEYQFSLSNCMFSGWKAQHLSSGGVDVHAGGVAFRYMDNDGQVHTEFVE